MAFTRVFFLSALLLLSACGFSPLYGTHGGYAVKHHFNAVFIGNIPDQEGQYLRNALIDRFYRNGRPADPQYTLEVAKVRQQRRDLDITKSSSATRAQLRLDTKIILKDNKTGETLLARDLLAVTSYNILQSQFTTRVSQEDAERSGLDDLARQIEQQLALYFNRGNSSFLPEK